MTETCRAILIATALICPAAFAATVDVTVGPGLSFNPPSVTIAPGDSVRWVWAGAAHTSTSDLTSGAEVWSSGTLVSGNFSHTFNTVGDWHYYCALHSVPGGTAMNGVVHVATLTPVVTPALSKGTLSLLIAALLLVGFVALRR